MMATIGNPKTRAQDIRPHTVKSCFTDTRSIRTPLYYGQFALSLGKENPYIFTIKNSTRLTFALPNVAKGKFQPNFQISFSKILRNK